MSAMEQRMNAAAHIMAAMIPKHLSPQTPDDQIKELAAAAAKMAKVLEEEVARSLSR